MNPTAGGMLLNVQKRFGETPIEDCGLETPPEYLIWDTPRLREYRFIMYAKHPDIGELIDVAVSLDGIGWDSVPLYDHGCRTIVRRMASTDDRRGDLDSQWREAMSLAVTDSGVPAA